MLICDFAEFFADFVPLLKCILRWIMRTAYRISSKTIKNSSELYSFYEELLQLAIAVYTNPIRHLEIVVIGQLQNRGK